MCGRFALNKETDDLIREFVATGGNAQDWRLSYNVAPTNRVPIIREWTDRDSGEISREIDASVWGFRPQWAVDSKRPAPINARLETVATNGMFRGAFALWRCLVPMNGYYEWQKTPTGKQPHYIHADTELLTAAGLYAGTKNDATGEWDHTFTIITREAKDASGDIHDRMPVFLTPDIWDTWLQPAEIDNKEEMVNLLKHVSAEIAATVTTYPVSRRVNNARGDDWNDPTLLDAIAEP